LIKSGFIIAGKKLEFRGFFSLSVEA